MFVSRVFRRVIVAVSGITMLGNITLAGISDPVAQDTQFSRLGIVLERSLKQDSREEAEISAIDEFFSHIVSGYGLDKTNTSLLASIHLWHLVVKMFPEKNRDQIREIILKLIERFAEISSLNTNDVSSLVKGIKHVFANPALSIDELFGGKQETRSALFNLLGPSYLLLLHGAEGFTCPGCGVDNKCGMKNVDHIVAEKDSLFAYGVCVGLVLESIVAITSSWGVESCITVDQCMKVMQKGLMGAKKKRLIKESVGGLFPDVSAAGVASEQVLKEKNDKALKFVERKFSPNTKDLHNVHGVLWDSLQSHLQLRRYVNKAVSSDAFSEKQQAIIQGCAAVLNARTFEEALPIYNKNLRMLSQLPASDGTPPVRLSFAGWKIDIDQICEIVKAIKYGIMLDFMCMLKSPSMKEYMNTHTKPISLGVVGKVTPEFIFRTFEDGFRGRLINGMHAFSQYCPIGALSSFIKSNPTAIRSMVNSAIMGIELSQTRDALDYFSPLVPDVCKESIHATLNKLESEYMSQAGNINTNWGIGQMLKNNKHIAKLVCKLGCAVGGIITGSALSLLGFGFSDKDAIIRAAEHRIEKGSVESFSVLNNRGSLLVVKVYSLGMMIISMVQHLSVSQVADLLSAVIISLLSDMEI